MSDENETTRRSVLNALGGVTAAGIGSVALSEPTAAKAEDVEWVFPDGYRREALTDLAEYTFESREYDSLRSKLVTRGYDVDTDQATVVRKLAPETQTTYVTFPLVDQSTDEVLGDLGPTPDGRVAAHDPVPESVQNARTGDNVPEI